MSLLRIKREGVKKRIHLTGDKRTGYKVLIKDDHAEEVLDSFYVPSYTAGNAIVSVLRELDKARGTVF